MENTQENYVKFAMQYLGQKIRVDYPHLNKSHDCTLSGLHGMDEIQFHCPFQNYDYADDICQVLLTAISNITDEHSIEVAKILFSGSKSNGQNYHTAARGKDFAYRFNQDKSYTCSAGISVVVKAIDFLRSKGYYIGDGTEIEYGWVKLKSE